MNHRTPAADENIADLLSSETFDQDLYSDPRGTLTRVLQAQERHLEARFSAHQQRQDAEARATQNFNRFFDMHPTLKRRRAEVMQFLGEEFQRNPDLSTAGATTEEDLLAGFHKMADLATAHLAKVAKEEAKNREADVMVTDWNNFSDEGPDYTTSGLIKEARVRRNRAPNVYGNQGSLRQK